MNDIEMRVALAVALIGQGITDVKMLDQLVGDIIEGLDLDVEITDKYCNKEE